MPGQSASTLALFAAMLEYPTPVLRAQAASCLERMRCLQPDAAEQMAEFLRAVKPLELSRMEEAYTSTFDMQPVCYPYLGYHLFGESYKRGVFMAKLVEGFRSHGYSAGRELPDHIAVVLRFFALHPDAMSSDFGRTLLDEGLFPGLQKMTAALNRQPGNPYAALLSALLLVLAESKESETVNA